MFCQTPDDGFPFVVIKKNSNESIDHVHTAALAHPE